MFWCLSNLLKKKTQLYNVYTACSKSSYFTWTQFKILSVHSISLVKVLFFHTSIPKYNQQSCIIRKQEVTLQKHIKCSYIRRQIPSFSWRNYFLLHIVTYQIRNTSSWKMSMFCKIILGLCWHKSEQKPGFACMIKQDLTQAFWTAATKTPGKIGIYTELMKRKLCAEFSITLSNVHF